MDEMYERLKRQIPQESPIDLDEHVRLVAAQVARAIRVNAARGRSDVLAEPPSAKRTGSAGTEPKK